MQAINPSNFVFIPKPSRLQVADAAALLFSFIESLPMALMLPLVGTETSVRRRFVGRPDVRRSK